MTAARTGRQRLLIGAGCFADAKSALKLAEILADRLVADLGGVLVEEWRSIPPGTKLVRFSGEVTEAPSPEQAAHYAELDAKQFRLTLSTLAETRSLTWSFDRQSGDLVAHLVHVAHDWDIVLLGLSPLHRSPGRVVCISPGGGAAQSAAQTLAADLAQALKTEMMPLSPKAGEPGDSTLSLLARLNRMNAVAVVADIAAGPFRSPAELRALLGAARCPVLLVGARAPDAG